MMKLDHLAEDVLETCRQAGLTISTAESCTGGLIGGALTGNAGSSDVFDRGFLTYSNEAKEEMLDVSADALNTHGAVSEVVVEQMAEGGLKKSNTGLCVAVSGVAGPGGGTPEKPVGLVYLACAKQNSSTIVEKQLFEGNRDQVRQQTVKRALELLRIQALVP